MAWGEILVQVGALNPEADLDLTCLQLAVMERLNGQLQDLMRTHNCRRIHRRGVPDVLFGDLDRDPNVTHQALFDGAELLHCWDPLDWMRVHGTEDAAALPRHCHQRWGSVGMCARAGVCVCVPLCAP